MTNIFIKTKKKRNFRCYWVTTISHEYNYMFFTADNWSDFKNTFHSQRGNELINILRKYLNKFSTDL